MDQQEQPAYYAILTAEVRYCKDLEPSAKLLYAEITALSNKSGYCWATNKHFADLYGVHVRTISRWIESLKNLGFIFVDVEQVGIQTRRKISIIKESSTQGQKCHPHQTKMSYPPDKNVIHNSKYNTKEKESVSAQAREKKYVSFSKEEYSKLCDDHGKSKVDEIIQDIEDYCVNNRPQGYNNYMSAFRTFLKNHQKRESKNGIKSKRNNREREDNNPKGSFINGKRIE